MQRRHFLLSSACVLGSSLIPNFSQAEIQSPSDAINKSGRQRMLSQRIAKAYFELGLGVDLEQSRRIFDASIGTFDKQLIELKVYAPTADIKSELQNIEKQWLTYKDLLLGRAPNQNDAKQILKLSDQLLLATESITKQFELHANSKTAQLVNISGRQRMLSQRMAKLYQAAQWKLTSHDHVRELELLRKEFLANMDVLEQNSQTQRRLHDELKLAQQQWVYFDYAIKQQGEKQSENKLSQQLSTTVATTSERILEQMDIVTGMFQNLHAAK